MGASADASLGEQGEPGEADTPREDAGPTEAAIEAGFADLPPPPEAGGTPSSSSDPWATRVLDALTSVSIDPVPNGELRFKLSICKDGRSSLNAVESTMSEQEQASVLEALERVEVPAPPETITEVMPGPCATIKYTFVWSAQGVR